ncbi:MAG: class I SAM-dependent methyltransferase, partial [Methanomassiliicoccaceae archaeon]|nr:class I SAM-dependent methyltransferase [Methanomassiliicoccaceae archaeon]
MADNSSSQLSTEYDDKIAATIPFYGSFHQSAIDLVCSAGRPIGKWLDTGCGTGSLCVKAKELFPNTAFMLADPSAQMLKIAKEKLGSCGNVSFELTDTQGLTCQDDHFDVITAIQCHHYLDKRGRIGATENCFRMLKRNGIFVTFENIRPLNELGQEIGLKRWENYQIGMG